MRATETTIPATVTIDGLAERLTVSAWTVRSWVRTGRIASFKVGKRVLIRESDALALLEKGFRPAAR